MKIIEFSLRYRKFHEKTRVILDCDKVCIFTATYGLVYLLRGGKNSFFMVSLLAFLRGGKMRKCRFKYGCPNHFDLKALEVVSKNMTRAAKWVGIEKCSGWLPLLSISARAVSAACKIWQTSFEFEGLQLHDVQRRN